MFFLHHTMRRSRSVGLLGAVLAFSFLLFLPGHAAAWDVIILKTGETVEGVVKQENDKELVVNIYFSAISEMEFELRTIPKNLVVKRQTKDRPFEIYLAKRAQLKADDADGHYQLAMWCKEQKLAYEMNEELQTTLLIKSDHAEARKALGDSKAEKYLAEREKEKGVFRPFEERYIATDDVEERKAIYANLKKQGYKNPQYYLDRIARSAKQSKGQRIDVKLTYRSDKVAGQGLYTIFVPDSYDPWKPYSLVLGLHGGGAAGKAGEFVNGSGKDTMPFYTGPAGQRNWIVVCPNALRAPWHSNENDALLEAVLKEMELLYNIDLNRVYLAGHSMGGWGSWHYGPKWCTRFAAISPNSGGGSNGFSELVKTQTPVYIYHGANDNVCDVADSRQAAKSLKKGGADFIYTELPDSGHGFPQNVIEDIFKFFDMKRLCVPSGGGKSSPYVRSQGVKSSFLQEFTPDETKYLASLDAPSDDKGASAGVKKLIEQLTLGGGSADEATKKLIELKDKSAVRPLCQIAIKATNPDARRCAAGVLGELGDKTAVQSLCQALGDKEMTVRGAAAVALGKLGESKAVSSLLQALDAQGKELESKKTRGNEIEDADWQKNLEVLGQITAALGKLGAADKRVSPAIVNICVNKILLVDVNVPHDTMSSYEEPKRVTERFCLVVIGALKDLGQPATKAAVEKLMSKFSGNQQIQDVGKEAVEKLTAAEEQR